jgi:hypothetical protein
METPGLRVFLSLRIFLLFILFVILCPPFAGADPQSQAREEQWALAEHLFGSGDYYRAITEYKRFLFYFPEDGRSAAASLRIVESYLRGGWWNEGLQAGHRFLEQGLSQEHEDRLLLMMAFCSLQLGRQEEALGWLRRILDRSRDPQVLGSAQYLMAEAHARAGRWQESQGVLEHIAPGHLLHGRARRASQALNRGREELLHRKSPWKAGLLAFLLPGAGHLYCGRKRDAFVVFSVNAAFIAATVEAIEKDNPPLAAGMALAELIWYSGNIFSAVGSAHKHNRRLKERLLEEILLPWDRLDPWRRDGDGRWRRVP